MIDIHTHFGQFYNNYYDPEQVIGNLIKLGVTQIGLMPTLTKNGDNVFESHQVMLKIIEKYDKQIIPILWVHPKTKKNDIYAMLNQLPYKILKVHGYFHDWHKYPKSIQSLINIARQKQLSIMFHTGGRKESYAFSYKAICKNNLDITFILAHSRPVAGTINILKNCPNAYCDTAFTPISDIKKNIESGFEDKILFGTDFPVMSAFDSGIDNERWYLNNISTLKNELGESVFSKITIKNFQTVLNNI